MTTEFDPVEDGVAAIKAGEMVVVVDDDDRENEGDLIMAASKATQEKVAFMIRHTSGILCTPILEEQATRLHLDPMVARNDAPMSTAFTVSIDYKQGLTTGISAGERAATVQALTNGDPDLDFLGDVRGINAFQTIDRQPDGTIFIGLVMSDPDPTLQYRFVIGKLAVFTESKNRLLAEPNHVLDVVNKINQTILDGIVLGIWRVHCHIFPVFG